MSSGFDEYDQFDALGLAELVRADEISPEELCEEAIERAQRHNPQVNAINLPMYDRALDTARGPLPDGPFAGVPFLVKDLGLHVEGVPLSYGSAALEDYVPDYDDILVERYRSAGLVFLGKTNTPELGLMPVTEPEAFGPTRNPWNLEHTPGGSSGGAAAAVAAGIVPVASASDGGGSIRMPSSACGLFGLKPTRGRTPLGPSRGEGWDGAAASHVISRSVRDSAAMLDAAAGGAPGAPYTTSGPEEPYLDQLEREPEGLKIAFSTSSPVGADVDPEVKAGVEDTARLLEELGHDVEEAEPEVDGKKVVEAYLTMYFGHVAADLRWITNLMGEDALDEVEPTTRMLGIIGESLPSGEFVLQKRNWHKFGRQMARFHHDYDLYLTPTLAHPPIKIGELAPGLADRLLARGVITVGSAKLLLAMGLIEKLATRNFRHVPYTQLANLTGQPAMNVPLVWSEAGLPLGVHFMAPFGDEATLLRLAAQLERARPWFDRRPDGY